jgi:beta-glucosidase
MSHFPARFVIGFFVLLTFLALLSSPLHAQPVTTTQSFPYLDPALPLEKCVDDFIGRMTLEEKVSQMRDHAVAIPRLGVPKYDWWNEEMASRSLATPPIFRR